MNRKNLFTKFLEELGLKFVIADEPAWDPTQDFVLFDIILPGGHICLDIYENEIEIHGHKSDAQCFSLHDPTSLDKVATILLKGELTPYPSDGKMFEESGHKSRE